MSGVVIQEIHADHNRACAFLAGRSRLGIARKQGCGEWLLKTADRSIACPDFDTVREQVQRSLPQRAAVFMPRTILPRHHYHGRLKQAQA